MTLFGARFLAGTDIHAAALVPLAIRAVGRVGEAGGVDRSQIAPCGLLVGRQRIPRGVLVSEKGVATMRRDLDRQQAGSGGRTLLKAPIAMPVLGEQRRALIRFAQDRGDMVAPGDRGEERVGPEPAQRHGKPLERVVVHALIGKGEDMVLEPRRADRGNRPSIGRG